MVKSLCRSLVAATFLLGAAVSAHATPIQFIGTFTPTSPVLLDDNGDAYSFNHDLTLPIASTNTLQAYINGVLTAGEDYDSATDVLTDGTLTLKFSECSNPCDNGQFNLDLGGLLSGQHFATTITVVDGSQFDLSLITSQGILSVSMTRTNAAGAATFLGSTINVTGERGTQVGADDVTPVPEPTSLLLLGTGLFGTAMGARRRMRRKA